MEYPQLYIYTLSLSLSIYIYTYKWYYIQLCIYIYNIIHIHISYHIISYHIISYHIISYHIYIEFIFITTWVLHIPAQGSLGAPSGGGVLSTGPGPLRDNAEFPPLRIRREFRCEGRDLSPQAPQAYNGVGYILFWHKTKDDKGDFADWFCL